MKLEVHIYFHPAPDGAILSAIHNLKEILMSALSDLQDKVAANTTVTESAITLLAGLKAELDAAIASGDPAALTALSATLGAETQKLADAVTANTPSA